MISMQLTVKQIADRLQAKVTGNPDTIISGVSAFDQAGPAMITFADSPAFLSRLKTTKAAAVIVPEDFEIQEDVSKNPTCVLVHAAQPKIAFFKIVEYFHPPVVQAPGIHPTAIIGENVRLGKDIFIGPNVVIEEEAIIGDHVQIMTNCFVGRQCKIGEHTIIRPNVTIHSHTRMGAHVLIQSGSVIGSDGFGFANTGQGHEKIIHTGYVDIGDHVEIGACNTIDRGTLGATCIGNGVKTDNQVHIAHNVTIGDHTLLVAQVGIAGSAEVGSQVIIAGKSGISGHLSVGDNCIVGPCSGVTTSVEKGSIVSGTPQMPHKTWLKVANILPRLPEMRKKLLAMEKALKGLKDSRE